MGVARWLGVAAAAWAVVVTCLRRLYFGHHGLSASAVGALLDALCATAAMRTPLQADLAVSADTWLRRLSARAPAALLVGFFALDDGCLYMFDSTRKVVAATSQIARAVASDPDGEAGAGPVPAMLADGDDGATCAVSAD